MERWYARFLPALLAVVGAVAGAQAPERSEPPSVSPHPAHSDVPLPAPGEKANPADATSPALADPLKQQAVTDPPATLATPAVQFITQASAEGLTEVQMARVALRQSHTAGVLRFAHRMDADHQSLNAALGVLAMQEGTSVPSVLDADHAATVDALAMLSGRAFDTAYVAQMRMANERALASYTAASSLSDKQVAAFAAGSLRMLRRHKAMVESLANPSSRTP